MQSFIFYPIMFSAIILILIVKYLLLLRTAVIMYIVCVCYIMLRIDGDSVATGHSESKDLHQHFTHRVQAARVMQNYNYTQQFLLKEFCIELRILLYCEFII